MTGREFHRVIDRIRARQAQQRAAGTLKSYAAPPAPVARAPMTDLDLSILEARRSLEQKGIAWHSKASIGTVMSLSVEIGRTLGTKLKAQADRIAALEKLVATMQKSVDHTAKSLLIYAGTWQASLDYGAGAMVKHEGAVFIALRDVPAGRNAPTDRDGSRWSRLI